MSTSLQMYWCIPLLPWVVPISHSSRCCLIFPAEAVSSPVGGPAKVSRCINNVDELRTFQRKKKDIAKKFSLSPRIMVQWTITLNERQLTLETSQFSLNHDFGRFRAEWLCCSWSPGGSKACELCPAGRFFQVIGNGKPMVEVDGPTWHDMCN